VHRGKTKEESREAMKNLHNTEIIAGHESIHSLKGEFQEYDKQEVGVFRVNFVLIARSTKQDENSNSTLSQLLVKVFS
jgi:hypothetical protein